MCPVLNLSLHTLRVDLICMSVGSTPALSDRPIFDTKLSVLDAAMRFSNDAVSMLKYDVVSKNGKIAAKVVQVDSVAGCVGKAGERVLQMSANV